MHREPALAPKRAGSKPWLLIAYAALVPMVVIPLPGGQAIGAVDILLPFGILALLRLNWRTNAPLRALFLLFVIAASASTIVALSAQDSSGGALNNPALIVRMFAIFVPLMLVLGADLSTQKLRLLVEVVLGSTALACVVGIVMYHLGIQVRAEQQRIWNDGVAELRAGGLLGNSGDMGHIAVILGATALALGLSHFRRRWVTAALVVLASYVVYISSSRAALLALATTFFVMLFSFLRGRRLKAALVSLPAFLLIAIWAVANARLPENVDSTFRRFDVLNITGRSEFLSSDSRLRIWTVLAREFEQRPISGIGYGNSQVITGAGDNSFLTILFETGVLAGLLYASFWLALLAHTACLPSGAGKIAALGLIIGEVAFMLTVDTHRMWPSTPVAVLVIGIAIRFAQNQRTNSSSHQLAPTADLAHLK